MVKLAKDANWGVIVSHRRGETEDSFIADLCVGLATGQIKAGAPCRGERLAKYNQVICYIPSVWSLFHVQCETIYLCDNKISVLPTITLTQICFYF